MWEGPSGLDRDARTASEHLAPFLFWLSFVVPKAEWGPLLYATGPLRQFDATASCTYALQIARTPVVINIILW